MGDKQTALDAALAPTGAVDVSVLIVSYNTREMTLECLASVFDQARTARPEVIVVDNASMDGSADAIARSFPQVRLIRSEENLGFARANNLAAQAASGGLLLLLNPDTLVIDNAIDRLVDHASRRPEARIWGGRTLDGEGCLDPTSCWARPTVWSMVCWATGLAAAFPNTRACNPEGYGGWRRDTARDVDIVTGCFLLIDAALWRALGGFDERFFMYGEEADLCLRARHIGARPSFSPLATIVHYGGASERVRADKLVRLFTSRGLLIRLHWPRGRRWLGLLLLRAWAWTRMAGYRCMSITSDARREAAAAWSSVWRRRKEWLSIRGAEVGRSP